MKPVCCGQEMWKSKACLTASKIHLAFNSARTLVVYLAGKPATVCCRCSRDSELFVDVGLSPGSSPVLCTSFCLHYVGQTGTPTILAERITSPDVGQTISLRSTISFSKSWRQYSSVDGYPLKNMKRLPYWFRNYSICHLTMCSAYTCLLYTSDAADE